MKNLIIIFCIISMKSAIISAQDFWQQSNGPYASNVLDIFIPSSNTIYISTYFDGIYKSLDGGESWNLVSDNLTQGVYANKILVNNKNYIFAANSHGLFRSTDNGNSWEWLTNYDFGTTNTLLLLGGDTLNASTQNGLYISIDDGNTWNSLTTNLSNVWINTFARNTQHRIFIGSPDGTIYSSTNEGQSWDSIIICDYSINSISTFNNSVFVATDIGIYRSLDGGGNWEFVNNGLPSEEYYLIKQNLIGDVFTLSQNGFFRSTNYGDNWEVINQEANGLNVLLIDTNNNLYGGSVYWGRGMYKSTDNGTTWQNKNEGTKNSFITTLNKSTVGNIWAGSWGQGLYYSSNGGSNWQYSNFVNKKVSSVICSGDNYIFVATSEGFYLSEDSGQNWVEKDSGLSNLRIEAMELFDSCLYVGTYGSGVYKSYNKGNTWVNINYNLPTQTIKAVSKFNDFLLCGTSQGIYRLPDSSNNWENIFSVTSPETIFNDEANSNIYIGTTYDGAYVSTDSGITWNNLVNNGLYAGEVRSFGTDLAGNIYAGTYGVGIYVSHDSGNNWIKLNEGLTHKTVNALVTDINGFIYAGTIGGGVYKSIDAITFIPATNNILDVDGYSLSQNYPNPFNPDTKIKYSVAKNCIVIIKVYDLVGKEIKTLVNEYKPRGNYEVEFNGLNLSNGIYFYQMQAERFSDTKKLILIK